MLGKRFQEDILLRTHARFFRCCGSLLSHGSLLSLRTILINTTCHRTRMHHLFFVLVQGCGDALIRRMQQYPAESRPSLKCCHLFSRLSTHPADAARSWLAFDNRASWLERRIRVQLTRELVEPLIYDLTQDGADRRVLSQRGGDHCTDIGLRESRGGRLPHSSVGAGHACRMKQRWVSRPAIDGVIHLDPAP